MFFIYDDEAGIHSGGTEELNEGYKLLQELYQLDNASENISTDLGYLWDETMIHWETADVKESGDARPFFDSLKNVRKVPASSFIISFLAGKSAFPEEISDIRRLSRYVENLASDCADKDEAATGEKFVEILNTDFKTGCNSQMTEADLLEQLAVRVRATLRLYPELRKKTDDDNWTEYFQKMLLDFNFSYLRDLAFAFDMDSFQFEIFLQKVLHRSGINFFNREEILTYIVLQYYNPTYDHDRFLMYKELCEEYTVRENNVKHPNEFRDTSSEDIETKTIQEEIDSFLGTCGNDIFNSDKLHELLDFVDDRSKKNRLKRSAERVFRRELDNLLNNLSDEITIQSDIDEPETMTVDRKADIVSAHPEIKYFAKTPCTLPKGLQLSGDSNITERSHKVPAYFELAEDVRLVSADSRELSVQVTPLKERSPDEKAPVIVKEKHVQGIFRIDKLPSVSPSYEVTDQYSVSEPKKIEVHPGKALHFTTDPKAEKGTLNIKCAPGTTIYADTIFSFRYGNRRYQYKVKKTETADKADSAQLPVRLLNADTLWKKKADKKKTYSQETYVVDSDTSICIDYPFVTNSSDLIIYSITTTKPVKASDPSKGTVKKQRAGKMNYNKLLEYLYGKEDYKGVTSYGPTFLLNTAQFKAAMLSYNSISSFPKSEVKVRDMLLTLAFLNFVTKDLDSYQYDSETPRADGLIADFTSRCNLLMDSCGLQRLYSGNIYDEFLKRLLTSQDPLNLYMSLFSDKHLMTQYIDVRFSDKSIKWDWKVIQIGQNNSRDIWGEGQGYAGSRVITLPRLVERNQVAYLIEITYIKDGKEEIIRRNIALNPEQEFVIHV